MTGFHCAKSAPVVAAGMQRGDTFDLALFDEANQTAGRAGVDFGFALTDKNLPSRQRLFLTATPRHDDVRHRDREGDARLGYSMDAPEVCGLVAHQLPFAEAARRGIIWRYEVVVSVVTSEMVKMHTSSATYQEAGRRKHSAIFRAMSARRSGFTCPRWPANSAFGRR